MSDQNRIVLPIREEQGRAVLGALEARCSVKCSAWAEAKFSNISDFQREEAYEKAIAELEKNAKYLGFELTSSVENYIMSIIRLNVSL